MGFRFCPTDEELINYFLKNKILGKPWLVDDKIREVSICSYEPASLPGEFSLSCLYRDLLVGFVFGFKWEVWLQLYQWSNRRILYGTSYLQRSTSLQRRAWRRGLHLLGFGNLPVRIEKSRRKKEETVLWSVLKRPLCTMKVNLLMQFQLLGLCTSITSLACL